MIDYEKLKEAYELTLQTDYAFIYRLVNERWNNHQTHQVFELMHPTKGTIVFLHIEDAIHKLKKSIIHSQPKYKVGEKPDD